MKKLGKPGDIVSAPPFQFQRAIRTDRAKDRIGAAGVDAAQLRGVQLHRALDIAQITSKPLGQITQMCDDPVALRHQARGAVLLIEGVSWGVIGHANVNRSGMLCADPRINP